MQQSREKYKREGKKYECYKVEVISVGEAARLKDEIKSKEETISQLEHSIYIAKEDVKIKNFEMASIVDKNNKLVVEQESYVSMVSDLKRIANKWKADFLSSIHAEFSDLDAAKYGLLKMVKEYDGRSSIKLHMVVDPANINYSWLVDGGYISIVSGEKELTELGSDAIEFWEAKSNRLGN